MSRRTDARVSPRSSQSIWVCSPPKSYEKWAFGELDVARKENLAMKLADTKEIFNATHAAGGSASPPPAFDHALARPAPGRQLPRIQGLARYPGRGLRGTLGGDYFSAYRNYMKDFSLAVQFCIAHLIRDIMLLSGYAFTRGQWLR